MKPVSSECLRCELGAFPASKDLKGMASISLRLSIEKDGTVRKVEVTPRVGPQIQDGIETVVRNWLFEPAHSSSGPVRSQQVLKLNVLCFTPGDSESGSCTILGPRPAR
jgi:hypothetical protein